jgi:hypothetical protein
MALARNLFFLFAITIFGIASSVLNIFNYNPFQANVSELLNFYVSLAVGLAGILAIAIMYIKSNLFKLGSLDTHYWSSIRQGALVSLGITSLLFLRGLRILDWLIGLSIIIVAVLLEMFFQTKPATSK